MKKQTLTQKITATDLKRLLREKHREDIASTETLIGGAGAPRFDAWAMIPTWTQIRCCGYEIKVTRSDFNSDTKWHTYLPYCTEFYFVCPPNLIKPDELPEGIGLLWSSSTGGMLYQKRKAVHRDIDPNNLSVMLRSVLMWRYQENNRDRTPERWLEGRAEGTRMDYRIKEKIRQLRSEDQKNLEQDNKRLKEENNTLKDVHRWLEKNHPKWKESEHWRLERDLDNLKEGLSGLVRVFLSDLRHHNKRAADLEEMLQEIWEEHKARGGKL